MIEGVLEISLAHGELVLRAELERTETLTSAQAHPSWRLKVSITPSCVNDHSETAVLLPDEENGHLLPRAMR